MKYKGLKKEVERLLDQRLVDGYDITLRDGTMVRGFTLPQLQKGCSDSCSGVRSYESYVIQHGVNGTGRADLWLQLYRAVKYPVET